MLFRHPHLSFPAVVCATRRNKGDYGFNVFHSSNPQHGGSYARHERRMREDEVEDFLASVKGWEPVLESLPQLQDEREAEAGATADTATQKDEQNAEETGHGDGARSGQSVPPSVLNDSAPPTPSTLELGEEAIKRTFTFDSFRDAYLFMGRAWAFCYLTDKYPHVTWDGCDITVYLYSPSFRGLSKREARVAAFLNDQYNMQKKSRVQQSKILNGVVRQATVEQLIGEAVAKRVEQREQQRRAPLKEAKEGPTWWAELLQEKVSDESSTTQGPLSPRE